MVLETALILRARAGGPVPGGLGVQDLGYVLSLRALGVARRGDRSGTAFVVMKRGKDLFWILVGFVVLAVGRRHERGEAARLARGLSASP